MGFIEDELSEVKQLCEHVVSGTTLVSCVPTMVRVQIKQTECKTIILCIQFPKDYPNIPLLIELKSKMLSQKFLLGLTVICEQELKKLLGKPQVLHTIKFIRNLSNCDELKLKQRSSRLSLKVYNEGYYLSGKILVPENYPLSAVDIQDVTTNLTMTFYKHIVAQAKEIARKCVEPPRKMKPNAPPFRPGPSLEKTVLFLIDCIKRLPGEECQICKKICFPKDPQDLEKNESSPNYIERLYCGHLFHQGCLFDFMKRPPFGNKKCSKCGEKLVHFKWGVSDRMAEERWAHQQARDRELQEVADFLS